MDSDSSEHIEIEVVDNKSMERRLRNPPVLVTTSVLGPDLFASFDAWCYYLSTQVWHIDLVRLQQRQSSEQRHPAVVAAYLAWACPTESATRDQAFVMDSYYEIFKDWQWRAPEHQLELWGDFGLLAEQYWPQTSKHVARAMAIFSNQEKVPCIQRINVGARHTEAPQKDALQ